MDYELAAALERLLEHYIALENSGDAGYWDVEAEPEIIAARAALAKYRPNPFDNEGK